MRHRSTARRFVSTCPDMPARVGDSGCPGHRNVRMLGRPSHLEDARHGIASPSAASTSALRGTPAGAPHDPAGRVEHEHGRGPQDVQPADQVEVRLGVDLDVASRPSHHAGDLAEHPPGRPAGLAERGGELDEGGPLAELAGRCRWR